MSDVDNKEQLDEISKKTKGETGGKTFSSFLSEAKTAKEKLMAILNKESEEHLANRKKWHEDLHNQFLKEAPAVLKKHGYKQVGDGEYGKSYVRSDKTGHACTVSIPNDVDVHSGYGSVKLSNTCNGRMVDHNHLGYINSAEDHQAHKKEMMPKFEAALIDNHNGKHYY